MKTYLVTEAFLDAIDYRWELGEDGLDPEELPPGAIPLTREQVRKAVWFSNASIEESDLDLLLNKLFGDEK